MRINHNISSLNAQGALFRVNREASKSLEKLSTGLRINRASDDAAGLGVSENLRTQVRGIGQALNNTQDFIALLTIAEGALNEQSAILQRMRELIIQAKNDTYTQTERNYMGEEFEALGNELDRIAAVTNYNGMTLFANYNTVNNPGGDPKTAADAIDVWGTDSDAVFGANDNGASTHFNMMVGQNYTAEDVAAFNNGTALNAYDKTAENLVTVQLGQMDVEALFSTDANAFPDGWTIIMAFGWGNAFEFMTLGPLHTNNFGDLQGKLNTMLQLIDGEALTSLGVAPNPAFQGTNVTGLERVNKMRAYIGAMINRLEHNTNNLLEAEASQQAAETLIRDVDFADETANFTKTQILTQSATSMLAQANVNPAQVLQLIQ